MLDSTEILQKGITETYRSVGRIVAKEQGKVIDSGTVIFSSYKNINILLTANHVLDGLKSYEHIFLQIPYSTDHLTYSAPIEIRIPSSSFTNTDCRTASRLDIGVIKPPEKIEEIKHIQWFNIENNAFAFAEYFRGIVKNSKEEDYIPAIMMGFPNFGKNEKPSIRTQISGMIPLVTYISHITEPPEFSTSQPSQISFEIDIPNLMEDEKNPFILNAFDLLKTSENPRILGGYSGGPLIYACAQGVFLIGIIKQGGTALGGIGFATPVDVVRDYLKNTLKM
jgi:hypothetical protein